MNNPYQTLVDAYASLVDETHAIAAPLSVPAEPHPEHASDAASVPTALIFSPHPDDECIIGALPLRLMRQCAARVINVAVTQGSRKSRQTARWQELRAACGYLGFDLLATGAHGLEGINLVTREQHPAGWSAAVEVLAEILATQRPAIIFMPHDADWNRTHIGTHHLVCDALRNMPSDFSVYTVETEFWGAMSTPNLLVESSPAEVADLVAALSLHRGEVARNPYHLRLPAWMIDNVRRGAELVLGQGEAAPGFAFATLYRLRRWADRTLQPVLPHGRVLSRHESPEQLFTGVFRSA